MPMLNTWWNALEQIFTYGSFCLSQPMQAPVCRPFWIVLMIGAFAFSALAILIVIWNRVSYRRKLAAALRAQQVRDQMPDEETLSKVRWGGDKAYSGELSNAEIDRRVREAVNQRRLAVAAERNRPGIVSRITTHDSRFTPS